MAAKRATSKDSNTLNQSTPSGIEADFVECDIVPTRDALRQAPAAAVRTYNLTADTLACFARQLDPATLTEADLVALTLLGIAESAEVKEFKPMASMLAELRKTVVKPDQGINQLSKALAMAVERASRGT